MTQETELKPCPFCGGIAKKMPMKDGRFAIGCSNHCNMLAELTDRAAVKAWNTRTELEKANEWQPIETAPKDDRKILVASFRVVKNHNDLNEAYLCCDYIVNSYYKKHGQGKAQKNFKEGFYLPWQFGSGVMLVPTHWQPIPTPPKGDE